MGTFTCNNCHASCCTCQGCNHKVSADGRSGCTKCMPTRTFSTPPLPRVLPPRPPMASLHPPGQLITTRRNGLPVAAPPIVNRAYWTRNKPSQ